MGSPSHHYAEAVLESLPDAIAVLGTGTDRAWTLRFANAAMRGLLGLSPMQEGWKADGGGPELDADSRRSIRLALASASASTIVVQARRTDGVAFWAELDLIPLDVAASGEALWSVTARDISQQIEAAYVERVQREVERRARLGLTIVSRVSDLLQESESSVVLRAIADMLSRRAVAWAGFVVEDRNLREVEGIDPLPRRPSTPRPVGPDEIERLLNGVTMYTVRLDADTPATPGSATAEVLAIVEPHRAEHLDAAHEVLVLPVLGRLRTLGLLVVMPYADRRHPSDDVADSATRQDLHEELVTMLELVARRVGMAMDNARLYAGEHQLAEALQQAMLPEQAEVPGLDVWSYYAPSASHAQVGGDWYDVVNVGEETVVVIGDVVGHDVEAAATMGQLRSVVRAFSVELVDPGTVLSRVDDLVSTMRMPRTASLVYATLTPRDGGCWDFTYSRAGHLPPLRVRGGTVTVLDGAAGPLMGYGSGQRTTATAELLPGDMLVLYTDGLIERRDRAMRAGLDALVSLCQSVFPPDAAGMGEELLVLADAPEDDVALVVVRVPGAPETAGGSPLRRRRWQLPAEASSIGRARHAVRNAATAWGLEDPGPAELVVSELMSNAVMHGRGRIGLQLHDTGDGLRIEVSDANPAPPITREANPGRVGGFGMHIVDRLAHWGWRPTPNGKIVWARLRAAQLGGPVEAG